MANHTSHITHHTSHITFSDVSSAFESATDATDEMLNGLAAVIGSTVPI